MITSVLLNEQGVGMGVLYGSVIDGVGDRSVSTGAGGGIAATPSAIIVEGAHLKFVLSYGIRHAFDCTRPDLACATYFALAYHLASHSTLSDMLTF